MNSSQTFPLIGITTYGRDSAGNFFLPSEYVDAVRMARGVPVLLAPGEQQVEQLLATVDALIFAGGGDFDPKVYGGQTMAATERVDHERDEFEVALAELALKGGKPVLGICRGFQLLNIVTGGTLVPELTDEYGDKIQHRSSSGNATQHQVSLMPEARLIGIIDREEATVVSKHHQALGKLGTGWDVVARAADGVVEAMEHRSHSWMVAVLWHPELALGDRSQQRVFEALVIAAGAQDC